MNTLKILFAALAICEYSYCVAQPIEESVFPGIPFISSSVLDKSSLPRPPKYPTEARKKGVCGTVSIGIKIGLDGNVLESKIIQSEPPDIFDKAAAENVKVMRFKVVMLDGERVIYQTKLPMEFKLEGVCTPNSPLQGMPASGRP